MEHNTLIAAKSFFDINPIVIGGNMNYSFVMQLGKNRNLPITDETAVNLFRLLEIDTLFDAVLTNFVIEGTFVQSI